MDSDGEGSRGSSSEVAERQRQHVTGVVTAQLPSGLFRVRLDEGGSVIAHIADRIDRNFVRLLVGDHVKVEPSPVDVMRGRIVEKVVGGRRG
jgi:translation initiation factor IF-1